MPKIKYEEKHFSSETEATITAAEQIVTEYQAQGFSLTLRQLYYQFVARDLVENTERSYKRLGGIISDARRTGEIDWLAIEDRTRYLRKLSFWSSPRSMIETARDSYHRDLWVDQKRRLEVWIEKDALVGVIQQICQQWDVPFFSCRGYVSDSEIWQAAMRHVKHHINSQPVIVLHLGDHDPSGLDMTRDIAARLDLFSGGCTEVRRIALTMEQIDDQAPPPNPAKVTDSRYEGYVAQWGNESWELDALEPRFIRDLIDQNIVELVNEARWKEEYDRQEEERGQIDDIFKRWSDLF